LRLVFALTEASGLDTSAKESAEPGICAYCAQIAQFALRFKALFFQDAKQFAFEQFRVKK